MQTQGERLTFGPELSLRSRLVGLGQGDASTENPFLRSKTSGTCKAGER